MRLNDNTLAWFTIGVLWLSLTGLTSCRVEKAGSMESRDNGILVASITSPEVPLEADKRIMADREAFAVLKAGEGETVLHWDEPSNTAGDAILRITAALDRRIAQRVDVNLAKSGSFLGSMDVFFATPGQVFELSVEAARVQQVLNEGIRLSLAKGEDPLWLVEGGERTTDAILPHLYFPEAEDSGVDTFKERFFSWASLQPCDWMGGCVLDGLRDWSLLGNEKATQALSDQLSTYFREDGAFIREDFYGRPADNRAGGVEEQCPFGVLALELPDHPAIRFFGETIERYFVEEVACVASNAVVAESAYNIAYPMAAIALQHDRPKLLERAFQQLRMTRKYLVKEDDLWLRYYYKEQSNDFKNWSRGVAWYMVGLVRTLALLKPEDRPEDLLAEVQRVSAWVANHQNKDGLWPCFLKETGIRPDTSGSAGIAAAIAIAVKSGMLDTDMLSVSRKTAKALEGHLLPGGWLKGASQSNKPQTRAMDIQRMDYRVIGPWGMGLYAQLLAAIQVVDERLADSE